MEILHGKLGPETEAFLAASLPGDQQKRNSCVCQPALWLSLSGIRRLFHFTVADPVHSFIHSAISIAPLQVLYYSVALPTTARILYWSLTPKPTGNCR